MRLQGQAKGGFYPTPPRVVDMIASYLAVPTDHSYEKNEWLHILDPCCGEGHALNQLTIRMHEKGTVKTETYGVELQADRAEKAEQQLDNVLSSDLFNTAIGNNNFGILYLNPPYDLDDENKRVEQQFLSQATRYLRDDGILIYIIPRRQLDKSARYIGLHYTTVQCFAFPEPEGEAFDQVVLFAARKKIPAANKFTEDRLNNWAHRADELPLLQHRDWPTYSPPIYAGGRPYFTTRTIDPCVAAAEAKRSGLWQNQEIMDTLWPQKDNRTRPLMPLRRGHLAMLVAAGFLDNLVLQADDERILVKGRTAKTIVTIEDDKKIIEREQLKTTVVSLNLANGDIEEIKTERNTPPPRREE